MSTSLNSDRARLVDIADRVGLSRRAVSSVLLGTGGDRVSVSEDNAKRIQRVAKQLGYQPNMAARRLRGKRSHTFGLLVASAGDPLRSFLVQYLDVESVKIGCHTLIANTIGKQTLAPNQFDYYVDAFYRHALDGVFCAVHSWFGGDRQALLSRHPNTVFYEDPGIPGAAYVTVDREQAVRQAVRHLVARGRRRIGLAVMSLSRPNHIARKHGYLSELGAQGLVGDERRIFNAEQYGVVAAVCNESEGRWEFPLEVIDRAIDALIRDGGCDAIIVHDDFWAAALIKRLRSRGILVPKHVAVVGYLNHYLSDWTDPALTTVDLQHEVAAQHMVRMLDRMIQKGPLPPDDRVVTIQPKLIVRESA